MTLLNTLTVFYNTQVTVYPDGVLNTQLAYLPPANFGHMEYELSISQIEGSIYSIPPYEQRLRVRIEADTVKDGVMGRRVLFDQLISDLIIVPNKIRFSSEEGYPSVAGRFSLIFYRSSPFDSSAYRVTVGYLNLEYYSSDVPVGFLTVDSDPVRGKHFLLNNRAYATRQQFAIQPPGEMQTINLQDRDGFLRWEDGSTDPIRQVTAQQDEEKLVVAYYSGGGGGNGGIPIDLIVLGSLLIGAPLVYYFFLRKRR